jgi:hypothetical protein
MGQPETMIDAQLPVEHDYNFLQTFCKSFETLNPASLAQVFTTKVNDEERFDGFCLCFKPQILRIVLADIRAFTLDACFIKHEYNNLKEWALYTVWPPPDLHLTTMSTQSKHIPTSSIVQCHHKNLTLFFLSLCLPLSVSLSLLNVSSLKMKNRHA